MTPKVFNSRKALIRAIGVSMPDEYPVGMAEEFADAMLKSGEAVIACNHHNAKIVGETFDGECDILQCPDCGIRWKEEIAQ